MVLNSVPETSLRTLKSGAASWVLIQRNPTSGFGGHQRHLLELVAELRKLGLRPRIFSTRERLTDWLADPVRREQVSCVVAAGGDGTFRDLVKRCPGMRVAILPLGTENLLARRLGIPKSGRAVAAMIAAGHVNRFDLGMLGDRPFSLMASVGFDAEVVRRVHSRRSGNIHRLTYLQPIFESLRTYSYPDLRVWVDDCATPHLAKWAILMNLPTYALGMDVARAAVGDDGILDLRLFERGSAFQTLRYYYHFARGTHEQLGDVKSIPVKRVRIESDTPVPIQLDGDQQGTTPAEFLVLPGAVEIVTPAQHSHRHPGLTDN